MLFYLNVLKNVFKCEKMAFCALFCLKKNKKRRISAVFGAFLSGGAVV